MHGNACSHRITQIACQILHAVYMESKLNTVSWYVFHIVHQWWLVSSQLLFSLSFNFTGLASRHSSCDCVYQLHSVMTWTVPQLGSSCLSMEVNYQLVGRAVTCIKVIWHLWFKYLIIWAIIQNMKIFAILNKYTCLRSNIIIHHNSNFIYDLLILTKSFN